MLFRAISMIIKEHKLTNKHTHTESQEIEDHGSKHECDVLAL